MTTETEVLINVARAVVLERRPGDIVVLELTATGPITQQQVDRIKATAERVIGSEVLILFGTRVAGVLGAVDGEALAWCPVNPECTMPLDDDGQCEAHPVRPA